MPINLGLSHVTWCIRLFHGTDPLNFHSCVTTNLQVRSYSNSRKTVQIKSLQLIHTLTEPPNPSWLHTDSNHQCIELSCAPPTVMWPLFLPKQYRNSLHLPSPWQESHAYYLFCPIFLPLSLSVPPPPPPPFNTKISSFFLSLRVISWLLVWSHRKYFQYSITVPKSLHSLPGGKQNSHLRFSCGAFSANIIPARSPPSAGSKQLTLQSPFSSYRSFPFFSAKSANWT